MLTNKRLREELSTCSSIKFRKSADKDELREMFGLPVKQWCALRRMKVSQLKEELKRGKPVSGLKQELLERLGVPRGFGESSFETSQLEHREWMRENRRKEGALESVLQEAQG